MTITKLEHVTHWVHQIVKSNVPTWVISFPNTCNLSDMEFNTTSGRHELECFFGIDFEQEQVDAWSTVQNIIDDVMNLWVAPITDAATAPGSFHDLNGGRFKGMPAEQQHRYMPLGADQEVVARLKAAISNPTVQIEPKLSEVDDTCTASGAGCNFIYMKRFDKYGCEYCGRDATADEDKELRSNAPEPKPEVMTDDTISAMKNMPPINRIERQDVEFFRKDLSYFSNNSLDYYQSIATKSAIYPGKGTPFGLMYAALGLAEAGEVQNKVKKAFRDDGVIDMSPHSPDSFFDVSVRFQPITPERRAQIIKELGGVLWYIAAVCDEINATMSEVALQNLDELCGRGERNTLRGDGNNR